MFSFSHTGSREDLTFTDPDKDERVRYTNVNKVDGAGIPISSLEDYVDSQWDSQWSLGESLKKLWHPQGRPDQLSRSEPNILEPSSGFFSKEEVEFKPKFGHPQNSSRLNSVEEDDNEFSVWIPNIIEEEYSGSSDDAPASLESIC